jgi:inhibitor of cysteine peptidase
MKMKRTHRLLTTFLVLIVLASACSSDTKELTLTAENAGQSIDMSVGETFSVILEGNPTTGFTWEVAKIDSAVLKQVGETEFESESDLMGAGGVLILHFAVIGTGEAELQLVYHRPWENDISPENTFSTIIRVK